MEYTQKDVQIIIIYSVVSVLMIYYSLTYWIPWLLQWIHSQWDRKRVLSALQEEVDDIAVNNISTELKNYRRVKPEANKPAIVRRKPTFALRSDLVSGSIQKEKANTPLPDTETVSKPSTGSRSVSSSTLLSRQRTSASTDNSTSARPQRQDLSTFAADSVEARLYEATRHSPDLAVPSGANSSAVFARRALRDQQDAEFRAAEQRDLEKQLEEHAKQERLNRVAERRQFLAAAVPPEPQGSPNDKAITLQFRFRDAASYNGPSTAVMPRIKRKFSVIHNTAADLLHFVESLELWPLLSGAYELTLDFPTRVVSTSTEGSKTLEELHITTDSVVWVNFSAD